MDNIHKITNKNDLHDKSTYILDNKHFIVTPIFNPNKKETLGAILLSLMKSDLHNN